MKKSQEVKDYPTLPRNIEYSMTEFCGFVSKFDCPKSELSI